MGVLYACVRNIQKKDNKKILLEHTRRTLFCRRSSFTFFLWSNYRVIKIGFVCTFNIEMGLIKIVLEKNVYLGSYTHLQTGDHSPMIHTIRLNCAYPYSDQQVIDYPSVRNSLAHLDYGRVDPLHMDSTYWSCLMHLAN